eukprot:CAMPEP_0113620124 /NCGR_PEP_ID=MMETSP0017_2-20120614/10241_1 /TAXON_ID=2856 /ORGANISM="Cylindrotheca closterium" /LENGTH=987 /DNA_ID=CAMNT_0000529755 /DNA_START=49 /DNA_END=3012 /DNA_ORIENTATION=- /assembly_acc=CAM_ASM_000147
MTQNKEKQKSLLQRASNKKLGASKKALNVIQSNVRAPVKKIETVPKSDESRVSALTASVVEAAQPAMVREVGNLGEVDIPVPKREIKKTSFDGPKFRSGKIKFGLGAARRITPQPKTVTNRLMKVPNSRRGVEVQKGIVISAPSPMSLDRIQVQYGQEKVLPESKQVLAEKEAIRKQKEQEDREAQYQKALEQVRKQLHSDAYNEHGQGFETQIDDFDPDQVIDAEREVLAAMMEQVQPSRDSPSHMAEARFLARKALASARNGKSRDRGNPMVNFSKARGVPVSEVMTGKKHYSDESISTIGNPHVKTNALVDSMDSTDDTAAFMESARNGACAINTTRLKQQAADMNCGALLVGAVLGGAVVGDNADVNERNVPRAPTLDLDDDDVVDLTTKRNAARKHTRSTSPRPEDRRAAVRSDRYAVPEEKAKEEANIASNGGNETSPGSMGGIDGEKSATGSNQNGTANCGVMNPGAGVMCGAVPLYFMYKSQQDNDNIRASGKMTAVLKSKNLEELQQKVDEAADIAVKDSKKTPKTESAKNKQILDKDDAYWDTLSTIASTRGLDEKFAPPKANPAGPIPIEITAVNDKTEEKKETNASKSKKKKTKTKTKSKPKTPETMAVKKPEASETKERSNEKDLTPKASAQKSERPKVDAEGKTGVEPVAPTSNENMNSLNAMPQNSTPKHKNNQRNISWGDEQIDKADPSNRRRVSAAYGDEPPIEEDVPPPLDYKDEQELLTRTLELSKELLASLANGADEPAVYGTRHLSVETDPSFHETTTFASNEDFPIDVEKLIAEHGYGNDIEQEEVIPAPANYGNNEYHHSVLDESMDDSFRSPRTPQILSKLDELRAQRAQALARFQNSKQLLTGELPEYYDREQPMQPIGPEVQQFFEPSMASPVVGQHQMMRIEEGEELESEASATPSKKAQDLRRQLDEALLASREIRRSQEKLGSELQTFKSRFSQRNGEIEDQALRAMRPTAGIRHADI